MDADSKPRTHAVPFFARFLERDTSRANPPGRSNKKVGDIGAGDGRSRAAAPVWHTAKTRDDVGVRAPEPTWRTAKTKDDFGVGRGLRVLDGKRHGTL
jgi:hypothetical protein